MEFCLKDWILVNLLTTKDKLELSQLREMTFKKADNYPELKKFRNDLLEHFVKIGIERPTASYLISNCENYNKKMLTETGVIKKIKEFLGILPECDLKQYIENKYKIELGYHQKQKVFLGVENRGSYVYIICVDNKYYKIGYSKNPIARYLTFETSSPYEIDIYGVFKFENSSKARDFEFYLHFLFADKKHKNEWFLLSENEFEKINEYQNFSRVKIIYK